VAVFDDADEAVQENFGRTVARDLMGLDVDKLVARRSEESADEIAVARVVGREKLGERDVSRAAADS